MDTTPLSLTGKLTILAFLILCLKLCFLVVLWMHLLLLEMAPSGAEVKAWVLIGKEVVEEVVRHLRIVRMIPRSSLGEPTVVAEDLGPPLVGMKTVRQSCKATHYPIEASVVVIHVPKDLDAGTTIKTKLLEASIAVRVKDLNVGHLTVIVIRKINLLEELEKTLKTSKDYSHLLHLIGNITMIRILLGCIIGSLRAQNELNNIENQQLSLNKRGNK